MNRTKKPKSFAGIPRKVMESADYRTLTLSARALLIELAYQYRGKNNGDLCASYSVLRDKGFKSKASIHSNIQKLLEKSLIIRTRRGVAARGDTRRCSLYALSWAPIDDVRHKTGLKKYEYHNYKTPPRIEW